MSPTSFRLTLAAAGIVALLWSLPTVLASAGCEACAQSRDLPLVATDSLPYRRIR